MGYYTRYEINFKEGEEFIDDKFSDYFKEVTDYYFNMDESCKWYDWDKDMLKISKKYPRVLFEVKGEGEEPGDIWGAYIKDGEIQRW